MEPKEVVVALAVQTTLASMEWPARTPEMASAVGHVRMVMWEMELVMGASELGVLIGQVHVSLGWHARIPQPALAVAHAPVDMWETARVRVVA